jgi:hypothetical protein
MDLESPTHDTHLGHPKH